jgi:hypothetical protein
VSLLPALGLSLIGFCLVMSSTNITAYTIKSNTVQRFVDRCTDKKKLSSGSLTTDSTKSHTIRSGVQLTEVKLPYSGSEWQHRYPPVSPAPVPPLSSPLIAARTPSGLVLHADTALDVRPRLSVSSLLPIDITSEAALESSLLLHIKQAWGRKLNSPASVSVQLLSPHSASGM